MQLIIKKNTEQILKILIKIVQQVMIDIVIKIVIVNLKVKNIIIIIIQKKKKINIKKQPKILIQVLI